jgi:dynein heavy chain 2
MSKEEWIVFRSKSYKFEEFLQQWQERLMSGGETTSLTVRLLQEVEKYKVRAICHQIIESETLKAAMQMYFHSKDVVLSYQISLLMICIQSL